MRTVAFRLMFPVNEVEKWANQYSYRNADTKAFEEGKEFERGTAVVPILRKWSAGSPNDAKRLSLTIRIRRLRTRCALHFRQGNREAHSWS